MIMPNNRGLPTNKTIYQNDRTDDLSLSAGHPFSQQRFNAPQIHTRLDTYDGRFSAEELNPVRLEHGLIGDSGAIMRSSDHIANSLPYLAQITTGEGNDHVDRSYYERQQEESVASYFQSQDSLLLHAQQQMAQQQYYPQQHETGFAYGASPNQQYQAYPNSHGYNVESLLNSGSAQQSSYHDQSRAAAAAAENDAFARTLQSRSQIMGRDQGSNFFGVNTTASIHQSPGINDVNNHNDFMRLNLSQQRHMIQNLLFRQSDIPHNDHATYTQQVQHIPHHHDSSHQYISQQPMELIGYRGSVLHDTTPNASVASRSSQHSYQDTNTGYHQMIADITSQRIEPTMGIYPIDMDVGGAQKREAYDDRAKGGLDTTLGGSMRMTVNPIRRESQSVHSKSDLESKQEVKKQKRASRKKPKDMPRRPFSAYNLFFSEERVRILKELETVSMGEGATESEKPLSLSIRTDKNEPQTNCAALLKPLVKTEGTRRPHRKTHGKVSFKELATQVGVRWRALPLEQRRYYQELADQDLLRHKAAMEKYFEKQNQNFLSFESEADSNGESMKASKRVSGSKRKSDDTIDDEEENFDSFVGEE